jgi:hypothetical protein
VDELSLKWAIEKPSLFSIAHSRRRFGIDNGIDISIEIASDLSVTNI